MGRNNGGGDHGPHRFYSRGEAEEHGTDHEGCANQNESKAMLFGRVDDLSLEHLSRDRKVLVLERRLSADDALDDEDKPEYQQAGISTTATMTVSITCLPRRLVLPVDGTQ